MSDDEDFHDYRSDDDVEYIDDDDDDMGYLPIEPARRPANNPPPVPPPQAPQPPPHRRTNMFGGMREDDYARVAGQGLDPFAAFQGMGGPMGRGMAAGGFGRVLGGMMGAGGGHGMGYQASAAAFRQNYRAYSTAVFEIREGRADGTGVHGQGRANLMYGGKILMPPEALQMLTDLDLESPWNFEIINARHQDLSTHGGVLEFIAGPGTVHLPGWMMTKLQLNEGDQVRINGAKLPKGKFIKVQAQSVLFLELSDHKAVLEQALRNYATLTAGDIIEIGYNGMTFEILIMETKPEGAISVFETDIEVDFAAPKGYVEPERKPAPPAPTMASKLGIDISATQDVDAKGQATNGSSSAAQAAFNSFVGSGNTLAGKRVKGKGTSTKKVQEVDPTSRIVRTDQPRIVTADTQIGGRRVPARLDLPYGTLFFGWHVIAPDAPKEETDMADALQQPSTTVPFAGMGQGVTLSGRPSANTSAAPSPGPSPAPPPTSSVFAGSGNTLSGRSSRAANHEVIEID
ncbi:hypothetical protein E5Q_00735 [Mixia osmundae IAM 14324]|uniref:Ubiquitin fusion degradation protein 1 n=1 Tax=Mixia osmundae (strain CBS 9802 / IAM 14324 / JCM 22182 / KY 12970) TaxID=764103 RepID=G7DU28_MIXOS|nr:hypothetical protein E5Q_00735 [Mixia osmundae IAM 14324]